MRAWRRGWGGMLCALGGAAVSCVPIPTYSGSDDLAAAAVGPVIPAGTFAMGCTAGQSSCESDEYPVHAATLSHDFWMGETEVTQAQWEAATGNTPSSFSECGDDCPVETVNWYEALAFANALSTYEGLFECYELSGCTQFVGYGMECEEVYVASFSGLVTDCEGYRLPTEAEWEYAARGGQDLLYSGSNTVGDVAWYSSNSSSQTHPVATLQPNAWGLYDMSGNVSEWTWSSYTPSYDASLNTDVFRVDRGGNWLGNSSFARVASRNAFSLVTRHNYLGFRLARTIVP